jgi:hypothetical protein
MKYMRRAMDVCVKVFLIEAKSLPHPLIKKKVPSF